VEDVVVSVSSFRGASAVAAFGALLVGIVGCGRQAELPAQRAPGTAATGILVDTVTVRAPLQLPAQLYVEHDAAIVARSAGLIDSVAVDLGDRVGAGSVLARLESIDQELSLAQAEASFDNLGRVVARARAMTKVGGVTVADSERAEFDYRQSEITRRKSQRDVELAHIAAPFAGVVTARYARAGRFVAVGDTLFRVTETGPLLARVRLPEGSAGTVSVGDRATIDGGNGAAAGAIVIHAAPGIDAASGTREVVLRLASAARLLPGASVIVKLGDQRRRVVFVPREAVASEGFVVVVENGATSMRPVVLGADIGGGRVEIVSGLSAGERIALRDR
jgi:membrane fusion protein, multidrug efflux system